MIVESRASDYPDELVAVRGDRPKSAVGREIIEKKGTLVDRHKYIDGMVDRKNRMIILYHFQENLNLTFKCIFSFKYISFMNANVGKRLLYLHVLYLT